MRRRFIGKSKDPMEKALYTQDHEWILTDNKITGKVGITEYATKSLGDVVYIELLDSGSVVKKGGSILPSGLNLVYDAVYLYGQKMTKQTGSG